MRVPRNTNAAGEPGPLLAAAFPDRIAQRRGEPGSFRLSGGGSARLPVTDPLSKAGLLVAASLELKTASRIRLAAPLDPDALPPSLAARVTEQVEAGFDPVSGTVLARRRRRLGALILSDRTEPGDPAQVAEALANAVAAQDLRPLPWTDATRQLQARVALMRELEPEAGWPDLSDATLKTTIQDWLTPYLAGITRLSDLEKLDLHAILRGTHVLGPRIAPGPRAAHPSAASRRTRRDRLHRGAAPGLGQGAGVLRHGDDAVAGRRPHHAAAGAVVPRRPPDRRHRRPRRLLERRLGRRPPRHARPLPEAPLAGRRRQSPPQN